MKKNKIRILLISVAAALMLLPFFSAWGPSFQACPVAVPIVKAEAGLDKMDSTNQKVEERGIVPCTLTECTFCNLLQMIERIFFWLLSLAFAVAVLFVIVSGFAYILAVGDSGMMGWAKEGLKLSIIGFAICLLAWLAIHVLYTVLGYKGNWWTMECAKEDTANIPGNSVASLYANEIAPDGLGGRNNPINLIDLTQTGLKQLPENKYFFIHGIGGQPLDKAAGQLANVVAQAENNKQIVYAAVPYRDSKGTISGTQIVNLNNFLASELKNVLSQGGAQPVDMVQNLTGSKTGDQFYNVLTNILTNSLSDEIPLLMAREGITIADFNRVWPKVNWNKYLANGEGTSIQPNTNIVSDLFYQEGDGPKMYDPDRFDGIIPKNDTHISININPDGSLNLDNPVDIDQVAPGVTEEALRTYTQQLAKLLSAIEKQSELQGGGNDFISNLTHFLNQSNEEPSESSKNATEKTSDADVNSESTDTRSSQKKAFDDEIDKLKQQIDLDNAWNTGGMGGLPSRINNNKHPQEELLDKITKQLEKEMEDFIKNPSGGTSGGDSTGGGDRTGTGSTSGTGTTGTGSTSGTGTSSTSSSGEPPGNWSGTTLGVKGQLSRDEVERLDQEIIPKALKDLNLNVPVDFVMCLVEKESRFKPGDSNTNGERSLGLTQINTGVGTQKAALQGLKNYVNNNDPGNIYQKIRRDVGSDQVIMSDAGLLSQRDPANERGITSVSMGIGYLKLINAKNGRGDGLKNYSDLDNLAAGYNAGPAGARGGNTAYSRYVVNCTKTMQSKRNANGGQSPWLSKFK